MKKILLLVGVLAIAGYALNKKSTSESMPENSLVDENQPRQLTDKEALNYAQMNPDVAEFYQNEIEGIKSHWFNYGFYEGRNAPYL